MAERPFARITAGPRTGDLVPQDWAIANGVTWEPVDPVGFAVFERERAPIGQELRTFFTLDVNLRNDVVLSWEAEHWTGKTYTFPPDEEPERSSWPQNYSFQGAVTLSNQDVDLIVRRKPNTIMTWRIREWSGDVDVETFGLPATPSAST